MTAARLSHQECWELLPWHANGTLAPDEAARVDEHLAACAICREEIRACREMAVSLAGAPAAGGDGGAGSGFDGGFESGFEAGAEAVVETEIEATIEATVEAGLHRVTARIDGAEAAGSAGAAAGRRPGRWSALAATPRPVRWLLAAQAAALVAAILGGTALRPGGGEPGGPVSGAPAGAFHTLSDPAPPGPAGGEPRVRVVFADGAAAAAVRDLLLAARARVVDGPTPFGVYTVETLAAGGGRDRGAELLLARLRVDPAVVFAEPALGTPLPPAEAAP